MNTDYVVYNSAGEILRTGSCPLDYVEKHVNEGEFFLLGTADCERDAVDPSSKKVTPGGRKVIPPDPPKPRPRNSLSTEMQLDLLWQAMDAGTFPKAEPFYSAIKASKAEGQ